ncbi:MAG: tripartite tricarboxylate transporter substrate-binding protein [Beijerinckiaceae bacterium]
MFRKLALTGLTLATVATFSVSTEVLAQAYPNKPINLIVPYAAGGPSDAIARMVAKVMSDNMGQQIVIENVAGAGGTAGAARVAKSAPDGYTLLVHHLALAAGASLYSNPGYDTLTAFEPVGLINYGPFVLTTKATLEPNNLKELLAKLKTDGAKMSTAHAGVGSGSHLCGIMLQQALSTTLNFVPYRGTAPALNDLVGGQVDMLCDQTTNALPQINAKTIKAFGVTAPQQIAQLPGLPTVASEIPGFELSVWHAIYASKGTPKDVVEKLNGALQKALADPDVQKRFTDLGTLQFAADQRSPVALQAKLAKEVAHWASVVKAANISPQ